MNRLELNGGEDCHYAQLVEECAELIVAIQHKYRTNRPEDDEELAIELVDVFMATRAVMSYIDPALIEEAFVTQLNKYQRKINE